MSPRYFQGTTVTGPVRASPAQTFRDVVSEIRKAIPLNLSRKAWLALDQKERDKKKHTAFFVPAVFKQTPSPRNYANALHCNLLFLDIDPEKELRDGKWVETGRCPAAEFLKNPHLLRERLAPFNYIAHTTASSTPEQPRMRVIIDADRIPPAQYAQAVLTIGARLKLPAITKESKVAVQAMFRPIALTDSVPGEHIVDVHEGGQAFTVADIRDSQGNPPPSSNGANGNHSPTETDELENLVAPDPDYPLDVARAALFAISADCTREVWIKCGAALKHQFSPQQDAEALELWDEWSASVESAYAGEAEVLTQWKSLRHTPQGRHPVTIRSLIKLAEEAGWKNPRKAVKIAREENYYDSAKKEFLVKNDGGRWLSHGTEGFKRLLRKAGFSTKVPEGKRLSPVEEIMEEAINKRDVRYAGPLAGRKAGFYEEAGVRFLVTESPILVEPQRGEAPIICGLLSGLVGQGEHGPRQLATAMGWLKTALESLLAGERQDAQALVLAGPVGCGKSLFQKVITHLLGGRSAKAMRYMSGQTPFNSELFGAEHLMLEDESSSTDIRARMSMAAKIKEVTVNETHSCHAKHREAVTLRPLWWMSITLNDEPEAMLVMPPMREDIVAKIILLQCAAPVKPFPTGDHKLHTAYWKSIEAEIPAFAQMLLDYQIPAEWRDSRFGVRYFHHPKLVENLLSLAPETKLMELIDRAIFTEQKTPWEGTAGDLESLLRHQHSGVHEEASRLFHWSTACGVYLGKLVKPDGRVSERRNKKGRVWTILPPPVEMNLDEY